MCEFDRFNTFIFDFDGTLFDTNNANYLAYKEAIFHVLNRQIDFTHDRFDRKSIRKFFPGIPGFKEDEIISYKENCFHKYLGYTYSIVPTLNILLKAKRFGKKTILLTKASRKRVIQIIDYYKERFSINLLHYFLPTDMYFKEDIGVNNKYNFIFNEEKINDFSKIAIIEDNIDELEYLRKKGFADNQLFTAKNPMFFQIQGNFCLNRTIDAYFHEHYSKYGKKGNPDYICTLKNDFNNSEYIFKDCQEKLSEILLKDFYLLHKSLNFDMVCMVPRAKKEDFYTNNQQIIRKIVGDTAKKLSICDGTMCILRNINTRTTHRSDDTDGEEPYKGITKDTCFISDEVKDKSILLVDDIYTETVNIDEDAIQALLDKGAKKVTFYAIAKTVKKI